MSRIGRMPIPVPAGVEVTQDGRTPQVKGPMASSSATASGDDLEREDGDAAHRAAHATSRAIARCTA